MRVRDPEETSAKTAHCAAAIRGTPRARLSDSLVPDRRRGAQVETA
jgi:hypothetical protein